MARTGVQRVFRITLPMLSPTIFFQLITGVIFSMQIFTETFIMTDGGPSQRLALLPASTCIGRHSKTFKMGYASALAWVFFVAVLLLTLILFATAKLLGLSTKPNRTEDN